MGYIISCVWLDEDGEEDILAQVGKVQEQGVMYDPHPVKRTAKKYKDFSQYGRYAVLWQLEIRVAAGRAT